MKLLFTILLMLGCTITYSQNKLNFCASVDANGYCYLNNNKFFLPPANDSLNLFMQVIAGNTFVTDMKITYKIYSVNNSGVEKYERMVEQDVKGIWMYAWLPQLFTQAGKYNIKAYGDNNQLLCSRELELFSGK